MEDNKDNNGRDVDDENYKEGAYYENGVRRTQIPEEMEEEKGVASSASTYLNLVKSIIGAGILGIPLALQRLGYVPGILVMLAAASLSAFGLYLLAVVIHKHGRKSTFSTIAKIFYPNVAILILLDLAIIVKCMGVGMSYLSVVGDVIPDILEGIFGAKVFARFPILTKKPLWVAIVTAILSPLVAMRHIDSLKYTSLFGLMGVVYLLGLSIYQVVRVSQSEMGLTPIRAFTPITVTGLTSFSIFVFAFTCHQNLFPIQNEAKDNKVKRMSLVITLAMVTSFIAYGMFGTLSGLANPSLKDKILSNYPVTEWPYILARVFYVILLTFSFPLQSFPTRVSILSCLENTTTPEWFSGKHRLIFWSSTLLILLVSCTVASLSVSLDTFLTIVGSTSGPIICYFLPALLFLKDLNYHPNTTNIYPLEKKDMIMKRLAQALLAFSIAILLGSTSLAVVKIVLSAKAKN